MENKNIGLQASDFKFHKKLNIYFTAGAPNLDDTGKIALLVQEAGADIMEIGMPYSDPVADGPIIESAHQTALRNGMTISKLFEQLKEVREKIKIPVILMGYINPVLRYGFENFCKDCAESGVSGLIIPDLPPYEFEKNYRQIVQKYRLNFTFLITPETSAERMLYLDSLSSGFLYAVSSSSTTGNSQNDVGNEVYLERLGKMNFKNPVFVGFGIKNKADFERSTRHAAGGIIGSAFVKIVMTEKNWESAAQDFIQSIRN